MIELRDDRLLFSFPEVHDHARLEIDFQRTLRLPDDGNDRPLPPGLGRFPLRHVDDFAARLPASWQRHGGVMLPMYQTEAMWVSFAGEYPFAVKIGAGRINAVTGKCWRDSLHARPQDYLVLPEQPWLDGFLVARGEVRQFVAMPLGADYTTEEQLTGVAEHGGLQIAVIPMQADRYEALRAGAYPLSSAATTTPYCAEELPALEMGLAPGGRIRQQVFEDEHGLDAWQQSARSRCFVHLADSLSWARITAEPPPTRPPDANNYAEAGLPWFEWYDDEHDALAALPELAGLRGIGELHLAKTARPLPGAAPPANITPLGPGRRVREPATGEVPRARAHTRLRN